MDVAPVAASTNVSSKAKAESGPTLKVDMQGRTFMDKNADGMWQPGEKFLNPAEAVKGGAFGHKNVDVKI
jgi:hypothetical protein